MNDVSDYQKAIRVILGKDSTDFPVCDVIVAELAARNPRLFLDIVNSLKTPDDKEKKGCECYAWRCCL